MTDDEVREALERAEKATKGPWQDDHWDDPTRYHIIWIGAEVIGEIGHHVRTVKERVVANADFVTHARSDVPALAADLIDTRAVLSRLIDALGEPVQCEDRLGECFCRCCGAVIMGSSWSGGFPHKPDCAYTAAEALLATPDPEARR